MRPPRRPTASAQSVRPTAARAARTLLVSIALLAGAGAAAAEAVPPSPRALFDAALSLQQQHRLEEAVEAWQRFVAVVPGSPQGHSNLGVVLARLGRHEP